MSQHTGTKAPRRRADARYRPAGRIGPHQVHPLLGHTVLFGVPYAGGAVHRSAVRAARSPG